MANHDPRCNRRTHQRLQLNHPSADYGIPLPQYAHSIPRRCCRVLVQAHLPRVPTAAAARPVSIARSFIEQKIRCLTAAIALRARPRHCLRSFMNETASSGLHTSYFGNTQWPTSRLHPYIYPPNEPTSTIHSSGFLISLYQHFYN